MRFHRKRTVTALGALAAVTLALTGCAPGVGSSDDDAEPLSSIDPADFKGQELDYVYFTDGPDLDATKAIIADFEKEYDVTVNLEVIPYADLDTTLQTRLSGGNAPDVARVSSLTPYDGDLLDLTKYLGKGFADEFLDETKPGFVKDGEILGAPSDLTMNGMLVNTDLFKKAGVDVPPADDPWTWDEMVKAAKEVQKATGTDYAFAIDKSGHRLSTILAQNGTFLVQDDKATLDPKKATEALQPFIDMTLADVAPKDLWLESGSKYAGANDVFLAQETPIYMSGNWQVAQLDKNATFGWAAAPNPCMSTCGGFPGGKFTVAFAESDVKPLAATFVKFLTNAKNQESFAAATNFLPTRKDLAKDGVTYPVRQSDMDIFLAELASTDGKAYKAVYSPLFDASAQAFLKEVSEVVAGNKKLSAAMEDLRGELDDIEAEG